MNDTAESDNVFLACHERTSIPRSNCLSVRGSRDWRAWVSRLADHNRLRVSDLIDRALVDCAEKSGFDQAAPLR